MNIRNRQQLLFAFPRATARVRDDYPRVFALHARVRERPKIKAYLESSRRKPFSSGLFRHYPELDDPDGSGGPDVRRQPSRLPRGEARRTPTRRATSPRSEPDS